MKIRKALSIILCINQQMRKGSNAMDANEQNQQNNSKVKKVVVTTDDKKITTRKSNLKEKGYYTFENMMTRNVKSQITEKGKVTKRPKVGKGRKKHQK